MFGFVGFVFFQKNPGSETHVSKQRFETRAENFNLQKNDTIQPTLHGLRLGEAIDRGWHDFVHCDEGTLRSSGFVDPKDDTVCFRSSEKMEKSGSFFWRKKGGTPLSGCFFWLGWGRE